MPYAMARLAPSQRVRAFAALLVLQAFFFATGAAAEIFKCVAKDGSGVPLYQNFPCSIDSLGLLPDPSALKAVSAPATERPTPQATAASLKTTNTREPRIGMTGEEVRALLGDPESVEEDEPSTGRISMWRYADGRTLQLDHKQRVVAIQLQN